MSIATIPSQNIIISSLIFYNNHQNKFQPMAPSTIFYSTHNCQIPFPEVEI